MSHHWDVVGIGENSVDLVYRIRGPLAPNGKVRVDDRRVSPGGQVATTLCTCARLGLRTTYVGAFGSDAHGRLLQRTLEAHHVDIAFAPLRNASNRHAVILVDEQTAGRTVVWQRDAALALRPEDLPGDAIAHARLLHVDSVDEE